MLLSLALMVLVATWTVVAMRCRRFTSWMRRRSPRVSDMCTNVVELRLIPRTDPQREAEQKRRRLGYAALCMPALSKP